MMFRIRTVRRCARLKKSSACRRYTSTWIAVGNQVVLKERERSVPRLLATVSGTVRDSATGEAITGATIMLKDSADQAFKTVRRWSPTNTSGFFSLRNIPPGNYVLVVHTLGYRTVQVPLAIAENVSVQLPFNLVQEDIALQEITIEGHRTILASTERFARGVI